jgi:hypothetical protein
MSRHSAAWLAWSLWILSLALTALSLFFLGLTISHPGVSLYYYWLEATALAVGFSTVGAVVASRMPDRVALLHDRIAVWGDPLLWRVHYVHPRGRARSAPCRRGSGLDRRLDMGTEPRAHRVSTAGIPRW